MSKPDNGADSHTVSCAMCGRAHDECRVIVQIAGQKKSICDSCITAAFSLLVGHVEEDGTGAANYGLLPNEGAMRSAWKDLNICLRCQLFAVCVVGHAQQQLNALLPAISACRAFSPE